MIRQAIKEYFGEFGKLTRLPREFWVIQALSVLFYLVFFSFTTASSLHSTYDAGFSDQGAGILLGIVVFGASALMIVTGPLVDRWGYRRSPLVAGIFLFIGLVGVTYSTHIFGATTLSRVLLIVFYIILALGFGLMTTVIMAGVKWFSNKETQAPAYNLWYLTMNLGAVMMFTLDFFRRELPEKPTEVDILAYREAGGNFDLMMYFVIVTVIAWFAIYFFMKKTEKFRDFEPTDEMAPKAKQLPFVQGMKEMIRDRSLRKVFMLLILSIPAHMPFVFMVVLYPKFWTRAVDSEIQLGALESINPALIIVGLILFAPVIKRFNIYWVLFTGMLIGGISMVFYAIPPQWVADIFGTNITNSYYILIWAQILLFTTGEFIWSPALANYMAEAAPKGKEGAFMGFGRVPFTIAKFVVSIGSGFLLAAFCPDGIRDQIDNGTLNYFKSPEFMFLILTIVVLMSPVGLLVFKRYFYVEKKGS